MNFAAPRHRGSKRVVAVSTASLLLLVAAAGCALTGSGRAAWRSDFDQMVAHLEQRYANLEWVAARRELDLAALHRDTCRRIDEAWSHHGCAAALSDFVAAMRDPHLRLERPWHSHVTLALRGFTWSQVALDRDWSDALEEFGMDGESSGFELPFADLPGFVELPRDERQPFPAALFDLPDGRRAGVLRIASFGWAEYESCGRDAWEGMQSAAASGARAAEAVDGGAFFIELCNAILRRLGERLAALRDAGAQALLIDLTGNGGGTDWVDPAARLFTPRPLRAPRAGLLRDERTVAALERALAAVRADLGRADLAAEQRALLGEAERRLVRQRDEAAKPVDRAALFREPHGRAAVPLLADVDAWTSGAFDYLSPDATDGLDSGKQLFDPSRFDRREGVVDLPLFVLVDGRTASASEYFAAILRDNDAALLLGAPTLGAGGGYVDGGAPLVLDHCGFTLRVPNCCRFRRDGTNEMEPMAPDVAIDLEADDAMRQVARAMAQQLDDEARHPR